MKRTIIGILIFLGVICLALPLSPTLAAPADIIGTVFNDLNGNGSQDAGEPGLSGVTVQMTNPNGDSFSATTGGSGGYLFTAPDVLTGTHTIQVTTPAGFNPTTSTSLTVNKVDGVESNGNDFGFQSAGPTPTNTPLPSTISGTIYQDTNRNGLQDPGEPGISGIQVTLSGPVSNSAISGGGGAYIFTGLSNGVYSLQVNWGVSYEATTPTVQAVLVNSGVGISNVNFGGVQAATPTPTNTPTATPTATRPARSIRFTVDDDKIDQGECIDFEWTVLGDVSQVRFRNDDDVTVSPVDERKECPDEDADYELRVTWLDGATETRKLSISVEEQSNSGGGSNPTAVPVNPTATPGTAGGPNLVANPNQGRAGETFTFVGSGFAANEAINVGLAMPDGSIIGLPAQQANSTGSFAFSYNTKPGDPVGLYTMVVEGQAGRQRKSVAFMVDDAATPTPVAVVITTGPGGSTGGIVSQPTPATEIAEDPLLQNQDPLLVNIQVAAVGDTGVPGATQAGAQVRPGKGGAR